MMRYILIPAFFAISILRPDFAFGESTIVAPNADVGCKLQKSVTLTLSEPAPDEGLDVVLKSTDPGRLLVSKIPSQPGAESVVIKIRQGFRESPEFWLQGLGSDGTVNYTASAPGFKTATGTITLAPSGIVIMGPMRAPKFFVTTGSPPSRISLVAVRLDASFQIVEEQTVAGGTSVRVNLVSSNRSAGTIPDSPLEIRGGSSSAVTQFLPVDEGDTTISASVPSGFKAPAQFGAIGASVKKPGLALSDQLVIGQNLQVGGVLSLGQPAPSSGVVVTIVSADASQLLLSTAEDKIGSKSITINLPGNSTSGRYYLQALGKSGTFTYTASAPGYRSRTAEFSLAPSGIVITPESQGPPDEAHVLRKEAPESSYKFRADLSKPIPARLVAWMVQLDPVTLRSADITVQPLRAGLSLTVPLANSNPKVGTVTSQVTIAGGSDHAIAEFKPLSAGETEISVMTPKEYTKSANSTTVLGVVH